MPFKIVAQLYDAGTGKVLVEDSRDLTAEKAPLKLSSISLSPSSSAVHSGETFDLTTINVVAKYDDGSTATVTSDISWAGTDVDGSMFLGKKEYILPLTLTCSYSEGGVTRTAYFSMNVGSAIDSSLAAPKNVKALWNLDASGDKMFVKWDAVENASTYRVFYSFSGAPSTMGSTYQESDTNSTVLTKLQGRAVQMVVAAFNDRGGNRAILLDYFKKHVQQRCNKRGGRS
ncbi:MAG: hypothetical protein HQM09_17340 [Candidatus Riflebacteria bacterium]|nr:hypothetical protein [Candidatus Riflebacteria bacterium]